MSKDQRRALVLGGGGVVGIAWETGLLAGLASRGVDLHGADLIVGTSAGAAVAAQVSTTPLAALYADQIDGTGAQEPKLDIDLPAIMSEIADIRESVFDPIVARKRIGELALAQDRVPEDERREIIAARLASHEWPEQVLKLVAIEAKSGQTAVFDKTSGVSIVDAVAASCAIPLVWPCVSIGGARYYDGGFRSSTNADVADGYAKVVVVKVTSRAEPSDVKDISGTSEVHTISVDEASEAAMGANLLDPHVRPAAARAGYEQGIRIADEVRAFWG